MKNSKLKQNIIISLMSVIALILYFIEMPIPLFPPFYQIDISDLPAIITGIAFGPMAGILVEMFKNILHLLKSTTGGVGELGNFIVGSTYVLVFTLIYSKLPNIKGVIAGGISASLAMGAIGGLVNYYILLPFFSKVMPVQVIIDISAKANAAIVDMKTLVYYGCIPFNLLKGVLLMFLVMALYKKVVPTIKELSK